jgi:hypothetical protein
MKMGKVVVRIVKNASQIRTPPEFPLFRQAFSALIFRFIYKRLIQKQENAPAGLPNGILFAFVCQTIST